MTSDRERFGMKPKLVAMVVVAVVAAVVVVLVVAVAVAVAAVELLAGIAVDTAVVRTRRQLLLLT